MHYHELIALLHAAVAASCRAGAFLPAGSRTLAGAVTQQLAVVRCCVQRRSQIGRILTPQFSLKQKYKKCVLYSKN